MIKQDISVLDYTGVSEEHWDYYICDVWRKLRKKKLKNTCEQNILKCVILILSNTIHNLRCGDNDATE